MKKYTATALGLALLLATAFLAAQETNSADFNGDGAVDFSDFLIFAQGFGKSAGQADFNAKLDLDGDGTIDFGDFLLFVDAFGGSSGPTDPLLLYIADLSGDKLEVFDTSTNQRGSPIFVSNPRGLAFSNRNNQLYVAGIDTFYALSSSGQRVYGVPLHEGDFASIGARGGFKVALSPDHRQVFVTETEGSLVEVFNSADGRSLTQIPVRENPTGIVVSPNGNEVFVAHGISFLANGNRPLSVIDGNNHTFKDSISVGEAVVTRMAISPDGQTLYLNNAGGGKIGIVDVATKKLVNSFTVGLESDISVQVSDLKLSKDGSRLFTAVNRSIQGIDLLGNPAVGFWGGTYVIDTATGDILHEIQTGQLATTLAIAPDGKTAYVIGLEYLQDQLTGNTKVFVVDLEAGVKLGSPPGRLGFLIDLTFNASKPAIPVFRGPELIVF